jgi:EmrB/QacA subfamily drug resistance transporter
MILTTKRITMFTVSLALFMDVLDTNIINTAIPTMARNFKVNPVDLKIALISYLLSLAIFIPISGWTADKYGAKRIFISALGLFTLSSFFCGYAHTLVDLVIGRSIQGIGGAFMISVGRLIIARTFERHQLVEAMNAVIMVVSLAVMLGPFVGGVITDHLSWPWIFWVNIPAGILAIILSMYGLKDITPKNERPFDVLGFILFGGSLALLCFSLSELSESGARLSPILMLMSVAILMFITCLIHAKTHPFPVIKIALFRFRTFRISVFGNLCARLGFGGMPFLLPLLQQIGLGFSAQLSGLLLIPIAFGIIFSKLIASRILRRLGYKRYLIINTIFVGLVLASFQMINLNTSVYVIACLTFLFGICTASQFTAMNSLAFAEINQEDLSASTSITSTTQVLAQTLGVAVGAILLRFFSSSVNASPVLTTKVFHQAFISMSVLTLFSIFIFTRLKADDGKQMLGEGAEEY